MSKEKPIPKGKVLKDNVLKDLDRRFISSLDLAGQGTVTLTIDHVEKVDELHYDNGNSEQNAILCCFKETDKPLVLNATNRASIILKANSNKGADWEGVKVGLYAAKIKAFGKEQLAVRIKD